MAFLNVLLKDFNERADTIGAQPVVGILRGGGSRTEAPILPGNDGHRDYALEIGRLSELLESIDTSYEEVIDKYESTDCSRSRGRETFVKAELAAQAMEEELLQAAHHARNIRVALRVAGKRPPLAAS